MPETAPGTGRMVYRGRALPVRPYNRSDVAPHYPVAVDGYEATHRSSELALRIEARRLQGGAVRRP
jgi:hypothetical protein